MDFEDLCVEIPEAVANMLLPDPALVNYYRMADERIFYLEEEISETISEIQKNIIYCNQKDRDLAVKDRKPIKILINSPGGSLDDSIATAQTIIASKTPVYTVNTCMAASGAGLILMAGHKRFAMPGSRAVIHSGSVSGFSGTYEQSAEFQKNYTQQIGEVGEYILKQTNIDEKTYKKNKNKDWYLNSDDQLKYGLVDQIVESLDDFIL